MKAALLIVLIASTFAATSTS